MSLSYRNKLATVPPAGSKILLQADATIWTVISYWKRCDQVWGELKADNKAAYLPLTGILAPTIRKVWLS